MKSVLSDAACVMSVGQVKGATVYRQRFAVHPQIYGLRANIAGCLVRTESARGSYEQKRFTVVREAGCVSMLLPLSITFH